MKQLLITIAAVLFTGTLFAEPIHDYAWGNLLSGVNKELSNGIDVNTKNTIGDTAMTIAAYQGHIKIIELLIANGADIDLKNNNGDNPLILAAYQGHTVIVKELIANGANVNTKNNNGDTPFVISAHQGHEETAEFIRKNGGKTGDELTIMPRLEQHGRFAFSFYAIEGRKYEVQDSFDLLKWAKIRTYTGEGNKVRFDEDRDHHPPQWFYRVRVVE